MSGQFGTGAEVDTSALVPKCLGFEVSWVRSVLTPSNIGLPILESRFNFGLTYDLCDVIVSNLCFTSHLFSHVGLLLQAYTL